jgi:DNA topoisomerase-3
VVLKTGKNIFDDSKIESHSAITPTYKIPERSKLTEKEFQVYSAVFRRFVAVFCEKDCLVQRTEIVIDVKDCESFTLKGMTMLEKGWTEYDDYSGKDKILPPLEKGDLVNHIFKPTVKKTSPPKHYTIETLNNYLKNPFREDKAQLADDDDSEEYRAVFEGLELGTEATRTGIIDNARKSGYILLKNNVYTILPDGRYLIETLEKLRISMDKYKTAELGKALKRVFRGEASIAESVTLAEKEIAEVFAARGAYIERVYKPREKGEFVGGEVGKCPICQKSVKETEKGFACTAKGCDLSIGKVICKHTVTREELLLLLSGKSTEYCDDYISRSGKPFTARLKLEGARIVFEFPDRYPKGGE